MTNYGCLRNAGCSETHDTMQNGPDPITVTAVAVDSINETLPIDSGTVSARYRSQKTSSVSYRMYFWSHE